MTFQSYAQRLARRWLLNKTTKKPELINIRTQLAQIARVLILLPESEAEYVHAVKKLTLLDTLFPGAKVVFAKSKGLPPFPAALNKRACVEWAETDKNYWGLPGPALKKGLLADAYDLVVDLNLSFAFFNLAMAHYTTAPLKMCFADPQREEPYNLIISLAEPPSWDRAFDALRRTLASR